MSNNFGDRCRDLIGGSLMIKGKKVIGSDGSMRICGVRNTGDALIDGNCTICGDLIVKGDSNIGANIGDGKLIVDDLAVNNHIFAPDMSYTNLLSYERDIINTPSLPEITTINFMPAGGNVMSLFGTYFIIYPQDPSMVDEGLLTYFWYGDESVMTPPPPVFGSTDYKIEISTGDSVVDLHDATRDAMIDVFGEGSVFDFSGEGGTVLTITNVNSGDATDPLNTTILTITVTQQGSTASTVVNPLTVPPVTGPFDYTTLQITQCPCLGNIASINEITGNITYDTTDSPGMDAYEYTIVDDCGYTRNVIQLLCQQPNPMPIINNCCMVLEDNLIWAEGMIEASSKTYGPISFNVMEGGDPIDWTTIQVSRWQIYILAFPDEGPPPNLLTCSSDYPWGTSSDGGFRWIDNGDMTWDQTPPFIQDEAPPALNPTMLFSYVRDDFSGDDYEIRWTNNEDGTYSVRIGSNDTNGWNILGFGVKVTMTVQDTAGRTSNEGCCRFFVNNND